jgi:hypothetical protein
MCFTIQGEQATACVLQFKANKRLYVFYNSKYALRASFHLGLIKISTTSAVTTKYPTPDMLEYKLQNAKSQNSVPVYTCKIKTGTPFPFTITK